MNTIKILPAVMTLGGLFVLVAPAVADSTNFETGWMGGDQYGRPVFRVDANAGDIPAFQIKTWTAGALEKLPRPDGPFGLELIASGFTDADATNLAVMKNLEMLDLA